MEQEGVLLIREVQYHPHSVLPRLTARFETNSIVRVSRKEELRRYNKPPLFDEKYLVYFTDLKTFENNKPFISFNFMFVVVHVEGRAQLEDAKFLCKQFNFPYNIYDNDFTRDDAKTLIQSQATQPVTEDVMKAIIRQVGLSPIRIITAVGVCEHLGYSRSTIERYVDKWVYSDVRKLIECLLGVPKSTSVLNSCRRFLHLNRHWYKYTKQNIVYELNFVLMIYRDKIDGHISEESLYDYMEEKRVTRARVMYALRLFEKVSITSVLALREFITNASLMEVVLRLG